MDIVAELRKWNIEVTPDSPGRILVRCPLPGHEDKNPSCQVKLEGDEAGNYFCPVCMKGGSFLDLLAKKTGIPVSVHGQRFGKNKKKVSPKKIEIFHASLMTSGYLTAASQVAKKQLEARALSNATLKKYMIGFDTETGRITIPVQWGDDFINVMKYSPGATVRKFENYAKGYGNIPTLYPQDQLTYKKIVLCGGFMKALVVAQYMNPLGIGAVTTCFGESKIPLELIPWLSGKRVWVCYDTDTHGKAYSTQTCALLKNSVEWVGNVLIPLNENAYPKGDVNDFFGPEQGTAEEFQALLLQTEEWKEPELLPSFEEEFKEVKIEKLCGFTKAFNFSTSAYLSGVDDTTAHKIPKEILATCTSDAEVCAVCKLRTSPLFDPIKGVKHTVDPRNPLVLSFVNIPHRQRLLVFREYFGIPEICNKCKFEPSEELITVRYVLLSDTQADSELPISAAIFTDGGELYSGEVCHIKGRVDQSPLNSEELRIVTEHTPKDILTEYVVKDENALEQFRTKDDSYESLREKIDDINFDLERNVTFIYDRPQVHTLFDLTFHSPLWVPFENAIEPGWISVLLVSETAQGKSTIMRRLISHYGHGAYIDAANTSVAGLVGGIKTVGKRQFVKWGILPQMDKRLVCIEEYANAPVELLRSMRAARDSGVVSMNKIDKGKAKARTRTIVLSNPKKLIKPNVVVDGVSLLEDLVERPEDLRRFDIGMWIPRIDMEEWHSSQEPKYSSTACHELITWCWTLPVEKIQFTEEAKNAIRKNTVKDEFPFLYLVGAREFDVKLARIASAIAARTYNVFDGRLLVQLRHVDWVCSFLRDLYNDPEFGYSSRVRREADMDDKCTIDQIIGIVKMSGNPLLFAEYLQRYNRYTIDDLRAAIGDNFAFDQIKNKMLILGCFVSEDDAKWNNAYLPTKRLKRLMKEVYDFIYKQYQIPRHLGGMRHDGAATI